MKCRNNNNSGFTLIELIVVVAIISIATGAIVLGAGFLSNSRVKKAVAMIQSGFSEARNNTMSKATVSDLVISYHDNAYYISIGGQGEEKILTSPYKIYYETCNAKGETIVGKTELTGAVTISFKRATGGMKYNDTVKKDYLSVLYVGNKTIYFTPDSGKYSNEKIE